MCIIYVHEDIFIMIYFVLDVNNMKNIKKINKRRKIKKKSRW